MPLPPPFPATLPPLSVALLFVRRRRALVLALGLSLIMHLSLWLATPLAIHAWQAPLASRFEAVLMPFSESPPPDVKGELSASPTSPPAKSVVSKKAGIKRPVPNAVASFIAPENAIAVERRSEAGDEGASIDLAGSGVNAPSDFETKATPISMPPQSPEPPPPAVAESENAVTLARRNADLPPVELPSRISIAYKMSSSISDGVADYTWKRDGDKFEIDSSMQATGFIVGNLIGVLHQVSRGVITPSGLQTSDFQIRRGDSVPDTAEFMRASNELKLTRAGQTRAMPLPPLLQDMQSFLFQLALDAPKLRRTEDKIEIVVTNARKIYRHRFMRVGNEEVQTRSGPVQTIHLRSEASDPEDAYEVWLATENYHLPVKIKFFAGRFPIELIAASIRTTP